MIRHDFAKPCCCGKAHTLTKPTKKSVRPSRRKCVKCRVFFVGVFRSCADCRKVMRFKTRAYMARKRA